MTTLVSSLIDKFLRPPQLTLSNYSLGPCVINPGDGVILRKDLLIDGIPASFYRPVIKEECAATIIYCHSYNSNRSEATALVKHLRVNAVNLLSFDFQRT